MKDTKESKHFRHNRADIYIDSQALWQHHRACIVCTRWGPRAEEVKPPIPNPAAISN